MAYSLVKSVFESGNLIFKKIGSGAATSVNFGVDGTGLDVKFNGDTASAYMLWDQSDDALVFAGVAKAKFGTSSVPLALSVGSPIFSLYSTCSSTDNSNSAEPFYVKSVMTGAGGVGGRSKFHMYTNVALGSWSNALKAHSEYGASGKTTGMGSALCAEITLSAGTTTGTYAPLESELILGTGASTGTSTSFMYMAVSGAGVGTFDSNGFLFEVSGLTAGSGSLYDTTANAATGDATLKIRVNGDTKYLLIADDPN